MIRSELKQLQETRTEQTKELARKFLNCTLSIVEPFKRPYKELSPKLINKLETDVKNDLEESILDTTFSVIISADDNVRRKLLLNNAKLLSCRGRVMRMTVSVSWIHENWNLFAGDLGFGARRNIFLLLRFTDDSLRKLVSSWWDPDVLTNLSVASSSNLISEVKKLSAPGFLTFSVSLLRLSYCQLIFHPTDVDFAVQTICASSKKSQWWK